MLNEVPVRMERSIDEKYNDLSDVLHELGDLRGGSIYRWVIVGIKDGETGNYVDVYGWQLQRRDKAMLHTPSQKMMSLFAALFVLHEVLLPKAAVALQAPVPGVNLPNNVLKIPADKTQTDLGGIALNSNMMDMQIKRDGNGVPLPISQQPLDRINIQGFLPRIISIQPVDLRLLLGINTPSKESEVLAKV
ncbi:MAG: hypothetical protein WCH62_09375 [Candidatus Omnitrophota bacterium]